jgi:hypothetical protein
MKRRLIVDVPSENLAEFNMLLGRLPESKFRLVGTSEEGTITRMKLEGSGCPVVEIAALIPSESFDSFKKFLKRLWVL